MTELLEAAAVVGPTNPVADAISDRSVAVAVPVGSAVCRPVIGWPDRGRGEAQPNAGRQAKAGIAAPVAVMAMVMPVAVARGPEADAAVIAARPAIVRAEACRPVTANAVSCAPQGAVRDVMIAVVETMAPAMGPCLARRRKKDKARHRREGDCKTSHELNSMVAVVGSCGAGR